MYLIRDAKGSVMATHSSMLHVRLDNMLKEQATAALAKMGLSAADAVRLLFHRIVADQAFPLELKVPNAETRAAMAEADELIASRDGRWFTDVDELIADIEASNR